MHLLETDYVVWIAALCIVVADSTILVGEGCGIIRVSARGKVWIRISEYPFLLRGREPIVTLLVAPFSTFSIFLRQEGSLAPTDVVPFLTDQRVLAEKVLALRLLAAAALLLLLIGHALSRLFSFELALLIVWTGTYALVAVAIVWLFVMRQHLFVDERLPYRIVFELLVCPFLIVNVVAKVAAKQPIHRLSPMQLRTAVAEKRAAT